MFTDKQSLFLCGFVVIAFLAAGILDMLDSYVIMGLLGLIFLTIIVNIFVVNPFQEEDDENIENPKTLEK